MRYREYSFQRGFSLLEVMVAGAIMSSGLAGLAALLLTSVSGTAQSGYLTTASLLADSMAAQMEISPASRQTFLQQAPAVINQCTAHQACTADQFSAANLKTWQLQVSSRLPGGIGVVCRDSTPIDGTLETPGCDDTGPVATKIFWLPGARLGSSTARVVKVGR